MSVKIVVFIEVKDEYFAEFGSLILGLRSKTLSEDGCIEFDVYKHQKDYVLIEEWESQESIDLHMDQSYTKFFQEKTKNHIVSTRVNRLEYLEE